MSERLPRFSAQRRAAIRECLVRSNTLVGGGHWGVRVWARWAVSELLGELSFQVGIAFVLDESELALGFLEPAGRPVRPRQEQADAVPLHIARSLASRSK